MQPGPFLVPKWLFTPGEKKRGGGRDKSPPFPAHTYSTRMRGGKQRGDEEAAEALMAPQPTPPDPIVFPPSLLFPPSLGAKLRKLANVLRGGSSSSLLPFGQGRFPPSLLRLLLQCMQ